MTTATAPDPVHVESPGWEVDAPDGTVIYLGHDLTLADELYNSLPAGARLLAITR